MWRPGLTFKLLVLLACIGVLTSGATGYYAYRANRTLLVREAGRSLMTSTELLARRSSVAIDDIAADAQVLASLPSSATVAQADDGSGKNAARERLAQVFFSFMTHHREYLQIRLIAREHHGNASAIARALSTSRSHVRRLATRFGIELEALRR